MATQTFIINPRNVNGTYTSPSFHLPINLSGKFEFKSQILASDFTDPTKTLDFDIQVSPTGVAGSWKNFAGFGWVGGARLNMQGEPDLESPGLVIPDCSVLSGKYVRLILKTNSRINIGATGLYQ